MEFTQNLLREIYDYDRGTGKLYYKVSLARCIKVGDEVGSYNQGYLQTQLLGKMLKVHRIIWKMEYGENPYTIDHINHNREDNRLDNLRDVTPAENSKNISYKKNKLGVYGVYPEGKRFVSSVRVNGKIEGKKRFDTLGEAIEHRNYLYDKYDFHPNHGK